MEHVDVQYYWIKSASRRQHQRFFSLYVAYDAIQRINAYDSIQL